MRANLLIGAGSAVLLASLPAFAHHPGGPGNTGAAGPINTISATTLGQGESAAALMFELIKVRAFSDPQLIGFASRHIHAHSLDSILSPSLAYAYGVTNDITVSVRMPYVMRRDIREGHHEHVHGIGAINEAVARGEAGGFGDVTATAQWRILNNRETGSEFAVIGGFKAPTGTTSRTDSQGALFEAEFQPGTGAWDWIIGGALTQRYGRWTLGASALFTFAGSGTQHTDLGDRTTYSVGAAYRLIGGAAAAASHAMHLGAMPEPMYHGAGRSQAGTRQATAAVVASSGPAIDAVLELYGERHGQQTISGVVDPNSGGTVVYLAPGVRMSGDAWSTFLSFGIPVTNNLSGVQAAPDYRLFTGVGVRF